MTKRDVCTTESSIQQIKRWDRTSQSGQQLGTKETSCIHYDVELKGSD